MPLGQHELLDFFLRCITQCLDKFQLLTEADPLLLRGLVYMCPREEYSAVFNKIPPYLSATLLSYRIMEERINNHEVCIFIAEFLQV